MSAFNLGLTASDISGSWLFDHYHVPLPTLIWLSVGTTALALLAVPLIPRDILARPDRAGVIG
jgi:hypothetical protein